MELLRNSKDKRARKFTKKKVSERNEAKRSGAGIPTCPRTRPRLSLSSLFCIERPLPPSGPDLSSVPRARRVGMTHADTLAQLGTLLRSKRKVEELSQVIQEQRRQAGH